MKPLTLTLALLALLFCGLGSYSLIQSHRLPVYTTPKAAEKLSHKLEHLPREQRFKLWYQELPKYETAHKTYFDRGAGYLALGLSFAMTAGFLSLLKKVKHRTALLFVYWTSLWAIKFPFSVWYYSVRQKRFDYPVWGDSIAIGIISDFMLWGLGFTLCTTVYAFTFLRHTTPRSISFNAPESFWGWLRTFALWGWVILLLVITFEAIPRGDMGMIISCAGAIPILLVSLSSKSPSQQPHLPSYPLSFTRPNMTRSE